MKKSVIITLSLFLLGSLSVFGFNLVNTHSRWTLSSPFQTAHRRLFDTKVVPSYGENLELLVNNERKVQNLPKLSHDPKLCPIAQERAIESKTNWSHEGFYKRTDNIYDKNEYILTLGENLARDFQQEQQIITAWMNSQSHRKNILGNYNYTCIRCVDKNCAQIFSLEVDLSSIDHVRSSRTLLETYFQGLEPSQAELYLAQLEKALQE